MRPPSRPALLLTGSLLALLSALTSCRNTDRPAPDDPWTPAELALIESLSPPPSAPPPAPSNRVADDERAAALGHALFFDTRLSANGQVACATCHKPELYFTDGLPTARGLGKVQRHAPTVLGAAFVTFPFWDGRKDSLWAQTHGPLESPEEHGLTRVQVATLIQTHYRADYEALFGPMPDLSDAARFPPEARPVANKPNAVASAKWQGLSAPDREAINTIFANVGKALEAYERKLLPQPAPFDAYVKALQSGDPRGGGHLSPEARRGLRAFIGEAQCVNCHNGPLLTDMEFHNLGLPFDPYSNVDMGRAIGAVEVLGDEFRCGSPYSDQDPATCDQLRYLNPRFEDFRGAFKTPSLRNVARTGPYMHDGQFKTLAEVIAFYKTLPGRAQVGHRELVLTLLTEDVPAGDLIAFLESLTGPLPDDRWARPPAP